MARDQLSLPLSQSPAPREASTKGTGQAAQSRGAEPEDDRWLRARLLERRLRSQLGRTLELRLTDNRRTMISSRPRGGRWIIRLHHMFADADDAIVDALARFLRGQDRSAAAQLDGYIERHRHRIRNRPRRAVHLRTQGVHHDLRSIFEELNARWFEGQVEARITWGRRTASTRRRSMRLGTYREDQRLIRIHPALDQAWVPHFFVAYVVFHEMLHAVLPTREEGGRQRRHCSEFLARERAYPDYERARRWEQRHIHRLLRS